MLTGTWKGGKNFKVGILLSKNLLGSGYRKQTTFFRPKLCPKLSDRMHTSETDRLCTYVFDVEVERVYHSSGEVLGQTTPHNRSWTL